MDTDVGPLTDYNEDGVDLTLIRWFLAMTPAERLAFHEEFIADILAIWEYRGIKPLHLEAGA